MNKYAILIGIDGYDESLGALKYAAADDELMRDALVESCQVVLDF